MKLFRRMLCLAAALVAGAADAMPPLQHLAQGEVQSFDGKTQTLTIAPARLSMPATFVVVEGRTRLRADGKRVTLAQVPSAGPVKIYYRTERGQRVATEISWRVRAEKEKP